MNSKLICGISAILDPKRSIHALTVMRAIEIFKDLHNNSTLKFILSEDYGSIEGGTKAAKYNIENNVDIVIGHFSSNAAIGAAEVYSHHNIPVLLPTATETTLTIRNSNIFRICFNNKNIAHALTALTKEDGDRYYEIKTDGSKYSDNLAEDIRRMLGKNDTAVKPNDNTDQIIFIGTIGKSEKFLHNYFSEKRNGKIILTDDAACKQLNLPENVENGQITGEVIADLINKKDDIEIFSLHRSIGFKIAQLGQFPNLVFLPENIEYFKSLNPENKKVFFEHVKSTNYSGIDIDESQSLFSMMYEDEVIGKERLHMMVNSEIMTIGHSHEEYQIVINYQINLADYLRSQLAKNDWQILNPSALPVICIRDNGDFDVNKILEKVLEINQYWISITTFANTKALRLCISSFRSSKSDIDQLVDTLNIARNSVPM
ncbi:SidA/IucD/PvdA family monooxygenase [Photorhabdus antumapuensis]|uniref:SidA/IucD/PvdA family monooxygenase n=1 Tax=Photorhabdus antumapuensis TaxID=2862867 RepID=UPI001CECD72B|nr:SidA/IucD/PvdA family monooxygenase [Photorhabdus antumapuensis]MCA6222393.1 SidA/IucD/PvdA family monooxygenase [Photorhabdus antumapuensis]